VPLRVLVLGQSRTGTSSMRAALKILGHNEVFHFMHLFENPLQTPQWERAFKAKFEPETSPPFTKSDWDSLLGHCSALTDTPCHIFAEELVATYPDAKVVLTMRDSVEAWYRSYSTTIWPFLKHDYVTPTLFWRAVMWLRPKMPFGYLDIMHRCMVRYTSLGRIPEEGRRYYEERNEAIHRIVPQENLLVFNVKEGWEPLCRFLEVDVPDVPFPRLFEAEQFGEL
ncbi:hypothetical protein BU16DRAFT_421760, partial [Lophium mytilinum]